MVSNQLRAPEEEQRPSLFQESQVIFVLADAISFKHLREILRLLERVAL